MTREWAGHIMEQSDGYALYHRYNDGSTYRCHRWHQKDHYWYVFGITYGVENQEALCQSDLYHRDHFMIAKNLHAHTDCPVCGAAMERKTDKLENVPIHSDAVCGACGLYEDHFHEGVAEERIGFYLVHGSWQFKPDMEAKQKERQAAVEEAQIIRAYGETPPPWPTEGDVVFAKAVLADWLDDRVVTPKTVVQLRNPPGAPS